MQKKVLAIHDISCTGRCSLTVALPILSVSGCDTAVLPTAVLSTHPGGFSGFTYRDLTDDIAPITNHWNTLDLKFDAIYSGFLGSVQQIDLVVNTFKSCKKNGGIILVDPVMADNGKLYSVYSNDIVIGMRKLCQIADIIVPNLTEASFILEQEYRGDNYTKEDIFNIVKKLADLGPSKVVLTGVSFEKDKLGAVCYDKNTGDLDYVYNKKIDQHFHGTGDIFGSTLLGGLMNDFSLKESAQIAVDYTLESIKKCVELNLEKRYGVAFEKAIPCLIELLNL